MLCLIGKQFVQVPERTYLGRHGRKGPSSFATLPSFVQYLGGVQVGGLDKIIIVTVLSMILLMSRDWHVYRR
jgi:hypothetical protein